MKIVRLILYGNEAKFQDFNEFLGFFLCKGDMYIFHHRDGQLFLTYINDRVFHIERFQSDDSYWVDGVSCWADGVLIKATPEEEFAYRMERKA